MPAPSSDPPDGSLAGISSAKVSPAAKPAGLASLSVVSEPNERQLSKLQNLGRAILPANSFYAQKLKGVDPDAFSDLQRFRNLVPFTTRHELVRDRLANPPYGTNLTFPLNRYVRCHQTSGTTTVPIRWLDTSESWSHIVDNWVQIFQAAEISSSDRFFFAFSFGPFLGFWSALEAVLRIGCFCFPGGSMSSLARLQAILDNGITVLCCTPTYALHLGEVAKEKQLDLSKSRLRLLSSRARAGVVFRPPAHELKPTGLAQRSLTTMA